MIFTKQATLFLVSTFGILSVPADGRGIRALTKGLKKGKKKSKGGNLVDHQAGAGPNLVDHQAGAGPNLVDRQAGAFLSDTRNKCADSNPKAPDLPCFNAINEAIMGPQAGINVTEGYDSGRNIEQEDVKPITTSYREAGLCPVNVHWHAGAEHTSAGEYDCTSPECGPTGKGIGRRVLSKYGLVEDAKSDGTHRGLSNTDDDGPDRQGFRCNFYDKDDTRFTDPYHFKYCKKMVVGETYEVHWPHGSGDEGFAECGTPNQYQSPFYRGLFCNWPEMGLEFPGNVTNGDVTPQAVARSVGVQGQVFTIINDEDYYYPDLFRGMITGFKEFGKDMAVYLGSSTGSDRDNTTCSNYTPITWQMDRKCHLISASSFDKLCADMLSNSPSDMTEDIEPAGARVLVDDKLTDANSNKFEFDG